MHQHAFVPVSQSLDGAEAGGTARLIFLDHWRTALVVLVVVHHVALVYGAGAPFYYVEPPLTDPSAYRVLLLFVLVNQAWFMGAFFLIAGYFTPASFDRHGPLEFLRTRLVRLGIPIVAFYVLLNPLSAIGYWQMPAAMTGITTPLTWAAYPHLLGLGPLWFAAMLLIFDLAYLAWRALMTGRTVRPSARGSMPGYLAVGAFILALALASYLLRMVVPMGKSLFGFPTLAYLPQYVCLFVLGAVAQQRDWLRTLSPSMGLAGLAVATLATVVLLPLALSGRLFSLDVTGAAGFVGNGHIQSAVYALWDSTFAVGLCLALTTALRRVASGQFRGGRFLSEHSYAVYVIHTPIVVAVAVALGAVSAAPLIKFALVVAVTVPLCFGVAYLVKRIPLVSRVL